MSSNFQIFIYFIQIHAFTSNCQKNYFIISDTFKFNIIDTFIFKVMKLFIVTISKTTINHRIYFSNE